MPTLSIFCPIRNLSCANEILLLLLLGCSVPLAQEMVMGKCPITVEALISQEPKGMVECLYCSLPLFIKRTLSPNFGRNKRQSNTLEIFCEQSQSDWATLHYTLLLMLSNGIHCKDLHPNYSYTTAKKMYFDFRYIFQQQTTICCIFYNFFAVKNFQCEENFQRE